MGLTNQRLTLNGVENVGSKVDERYGDKGHNRCGVLGEGLKWRLRFGGVWGEPGNPVCVSGGYLLQY